MKSQKDILNKLIAADDLYWDEYEGRYIVHSKEEIDSILTSCIENGISNQSDIIKIVNWCTSVRVGNLLMKGFLAGKILILGVDKDGEPIFGQQSPEGLHNQSDD
jgi:hypothetical protein